MLPFGINALTRTERISDITFTKNTAAQLSTQSGNLPTDRFIHSLVLEWEGRITNPSSLNPTAVLDDGPYALIERIIVEGYHRVRSRTEKFIDVRGADLRRLCAMYYTRDQNLQPAQLDIAASATNDIRFFIDVPFVPLKLPARQQTGWLLDAPNYDSLRLTIQFGDDFSVFSGQTGTMTFSAFGSGGGSPRLRVGARYTMAGAQKFAGFLPGRIWRFFQDNQSSDLTSTGVATRLFNVPRGNMIRSILLKTGVKATTSVGSGNLPFATLNNNVLTNVRLFRGINKIVRDYNSFRDINNNQDQSYAFSPPAGYALIDFVQNGEDQEIFDLRSAVAGPTGDVDTFIAADVTGVSNQVATVLYEEWRHRPVGVL